MFLLRAVSAVYYIRSVFLNRYRFFNILHQHIRNFNVFQASVHVSAVLLEQCTHRINFIWGVFILLWMIHYNSWAFRIQTYENMPAFKCRQISAVVFRMFFFYYVHFLKKVYEEFNSIYHEKNFEHVFDAFLWIDNVWKHLKAFFDTNFVIWKNVIWFIKLILLVLPSIWW